MKKIFFENEIENEILKRENPKNRKKEKNKILIKGFFVYVLVFIAFIVFVCWCAKYRAIVFKGSMMRCDAFLVVGWCKLSFCGRKCVRIDFLNELLLLCVYMCV